MLARIKEEYKNKVLNVNSFIEKLPKTIQIEPTNFCNLKCPACSTAYIKEKNKYLKTDEFIHIANQLEKGSTITLYHFGEPFLNPDIFDIIKEGKKRNFILVIHSNLNIDKALLPEIVDSGLDYLSASIDGATAETYLLYRLKGDFNLALDNFKELVRLRKEKQAKHFNIKFQVVLNKYNEKEKDRIKKILDEMPDKVAYGFVPMGFREDNVDWDNLNEDELKSTIEYWLPKEKRNRMYRYSKNKPKALMEPIRCPHIWDTLSINVYGDVTPCCYTYKKEHSFGNVFETPLIDIWNNEKYISSRKYFLDKNYTDCNTVCSKCRNYIRSGKGNILSRNIEFVIWLGSKAKDKFRRLNP
ncbi:MAG: SPASM domain-containing protein [Ignavibacteriae bacterium]|nr:SPASM domain-containing protein [Ignavibacteriota bacterium]